MKRMHRTRKLLSVTSAVVFAITGLPRLALAQTTKTAPPATAKGAAIKAASKSTGGVQTGGQQKVVRRDMNAHIQALKQQFAQQGRPLIRSELIFVRHVCGLTAEQTRPIAREAELVLEKIAEKMAEDQLNGRMRIVAMGNQTATPQPSDQLQELLAASLQKHLNPAQWLRYQAETLKRSADRKEAGVRFLTESLARDLTLSDRQRELVNQALAGAWNENWAVSVDYLFLGNIYYPQTVDSAIVNFLDDEQKKIWRSAQKIGQFWGFGNSFAMMAIHDGDPLVAELGFDVEPANRNPFPGGRADVQIMQKAADPPVRKTEVQKAAIPNKK
jgi:hypothetical protein